MKSIFYLFLVYLTIVSKAYADMRFETFNVGLAHGYVPYTKERISLLIQALGQSQSDVLCLQEVWRKDDRKQFIHGLKKQFPYIFYSPIKQEKTINKPSCRFRDIFGEGKFVSCMRSMCSGNSSDQLTECIVNNCYNALKALKKANRQCSQALFAKVGQNPTLAILSLLNGFSASGIYVHGGSNGLMLFSKYPLTSKETIEMGHLSTLVRRDILKAKVHIGQNNITLFCTHLASHLNIPYVGKFISWENENEQQVKELLSVTKSYNPALLMGDFNCSPHGHNIDAVFPHSCSLLNFSFQRVGQKAGLCTFCSHNRINKEPKDFFIDHIYLRGLKAKNFKRVYTQPVTIQKTGFFFWLKQSVLIHLSDHYGFQANVSPQEDMLK